MPMENGMTINEIQDRVIDEFAGLEDWIDKYEFLIALGKELPPFDEELKTEDNALDGCQARVWVHAERVRGNIIYSAYSDALITRGLIALLLRILNDRTPEEVQNADLYFIPRIGLRSHLSPSRAAGLASIVKRLKRIAANSGSGLKN